ncbi:MAG: hypoxanthine phosphoribosyltransferase [bacterium]
MEIKEILITSQEIEIAVNNIARQLNEHYKTNQPVIFVTILKGAIVFASDLMRKLNFPITLDFISATSYGSSTKTSGVVKILKDLDTPIENQNVLLVEDIVDTGLTLKYLKEILMARKPKSLKLCALLDKHSRREVDLDVDFLGIKIPDKFVVGYGLDWNEQYRYLSHICVVG